MSPPQERLDEELGRVTTVEPPDSKRGRGSTPSTPGKHDAAAVRELKPRLEKFFKEIIAPIVKVADEYDGRIIEKKAGQLANAYAILAGESPVVRRALYALLSSGGPVAAAVFVTASTALPILHHHNIVQLAPELGIPLIGEKLEEPQHVTPDQSAKQGENGSGNDSSLDSEAFATEVPPAI